MYRALLLSAVCLLASAGVDARYTQIDFNSRSCIYPGEAAVQSCGVTFIHEAIYSTKFSWDGAWSDNQTKRCSGDGNVCVTINDKGVCTKLHYRNQEYPCGNLDKNESKKEGWLCATLHKQYTTDI